VVANNQQHGNMVGKLKPLTLALLFGGKSEQPQSRVKTPLEELDAERSWLPEAQAEVEEDERPDDGEVEIPSDEEFVG
jgi:hypothetical protein